MEILEIWRHVYSCCFVLPLQRQMPGGRTERSGKQAASTFKASSQMVLETVSVTDRSGAPVSGLEAKDFAITEDGAPQTISVFEYQNLDNATAAPPSHYR